MKNWHKCDCETCGEQFKRIQELETKLAAVPAQEAKPTPVAMIAHGGQTRVNDYRMSDGTVQTMTLSEAKAAGYGAPHAERGPAKGCICQEEHRRGYCTEPGCQNAMSPEVRATEPRRITGEDNNYASELLADLANGEEPRLQVAAQWFAKARVEHSLGRSSPAASVPQGWKLVPIAPDQKMIEAGYENNPTSWNEGIPSGFAADVANDVYVSMVRAAPECSSQPDIVSENELRETIRGVSIECGEVSDVIDKSELAAIAAALLSKYNVVRK